jgi:hypothetical protein
MIDAHKDVSRSWHLYHVTPVVEMGPQHLEGEAPVRVDVVLVAHDDGCLIQTHWQPVDGRSISAKYGGLEVSIDKIEIDVIDPH